MSSCIWVFSPKTHLLRPWLILHAVMLIYECRALLLKLCHIIYVFCYQGLDNLKFFFLFCDKFTSHCHYCPLFPAAVPAACGRACPIMPAERSKGTDRRKDGWTDKAGQIYV